MKIFLLSDLHGNLEALRCVLDVMDRYIADGIVLLGDLVDYGPHSNEVVSCIKKLTMPVICNIRGNHEMAIIQGCYDRFSSERGKQSAQYTKLQLTQDTWEYITLAMHDTGKYEFVLDGKKCLAIHGSLEDEYWKAIEPGQNFAAYGEYDYVFSGHSHLPHFFEIYYKTESPRFRNKKKTIFINPGSVGQPRNLNCCAQFAMLNTDTEEIIMKKVFYDIKKEQDSFSDEVNIFYKTRLEVGV